MTAIAAVIAIASFIVVMPLMNYNKAISAFENENYILAYELFDRLGNYKDSQSYKEKVYPWYVKSTLANCSVGDIVNMGTYEQDNNSTNGKEAIEWRVLSKQGNRVLLISLYALDNQKYNTSRNPTNWETCSLRTWLNSEFYNEAFFDTDKALIETSTVTASENPSCDTDQGNYTSDKIFLLSIEQVNKYFSSDIERQCKATKYAYAKGVDKNKKNGNCCWWLRTSGSDPTYAARVSHGGGVGNFGFYVDDGGSAVRPALWVTAK